MAPALRFCRWAYASRMGCWRAGSVCPEVFRSRAEELVQCAASTDAADLLPGDRFPHIRITEQAFPPAGEIAVAAVRKRLRESVPGPETELLELAAIAALEDASWTSKDGQYLRWDHRSGRSLKARMEKAECTVICGFAGQQIVSDSR